MECLTSTRRNRAKLLTVQVYGSATEIFTGITQTKRLVRDQLTISGAKLLQRPHKLDKLQFLGLWHRLLSILINSFLELMICWLIFLISGNKSLAVSFLVYRNATLFPSTFLANKSQNKNEGVQRISPVISATIEGIKVKNLTADNPVETHFALSEVSFTFHHEIRIKVRHGRSIT